MSGKRYLLDTNAIIALLQGNNQLLQSLGDAEWLGVSVISQLEFLAFSQLSESDRQLFQKFLQRVDVVDLTSANTDLITKIINIRQQFRLKLPDAIIAAMALQNAATLVTKDQEFSKVNHLVTMNW